jgi:ADP-heptose:LPS heptosyltransferase
VRSLNVKNRIIPKIKRKNNGSFSFSNLKSICIDRPVGGIGDVLMASIAIREFKRCYPNVKVTVALDRHTTYDDTYYKLLYNAPFIDNFEDSRYVVREKYSKYFNIRSVCIEHEYSGRPEANRIDIFARACRVKKIQNRIPFYKETEEENIQANKIFKKYKDNLKFFIHSASNEGKRSYHWQNTKKLINLLKKEFPESIIFVSDFNNVLKKQKYDNRVINISRLNIRESASYIKRSDFFFGPDSGLMHLSAAVGTKSLVVFGSIPPSSRINHYPTHKSIRLEKLDCLGCWYKSCPINVKCMKDLRPEKVLNKIKEML